MNFENYWQTAYSDCPAIPSQLRHVYPERWVRIHTLPNSKRYAENEDEYGIILQRHNAVLDHLAKPGEMLWLISTEFDDTAGRTRCPTMVEVDPDATLIQKFKAGSNNDQLPMRLLYGSEWRWMPGTFDSVLRLVADWKIADVMIVSPTGNWICAPYDGGADFVLSNQHQRNQLKLRFADWLSHHPAGL